MRRGRRNLPAGVPDIAGLLWIIGGGLLALAFAAGVAFYLMQEWSEPPEPNQPPDQSARNAATDSERPSESAN